MTMDINGVQGPKDNNQLSQMQKISVSGTPEITIKFPRNIEKTDSDYGLGVNSNKTAKEKYNTQLQNFLRFSPLREDFISADEMEVPVLELTPMGWEKSNYITMNGGTVYEKIQNGKHASITIEDSHGKMNIYERDGLRHTALYDDSGKETGGVIDKKYDDGTSISYVYEVDSDGNQVVTKATKYIPGLDQTVILYDAEGAEVDFASIQPKSESSKKVLIPERSKQSVVNSEMLPQQGWAAQYTENVIKRTENSDGSVTLICETPTENGIEYSKVNVKYNDNGTLSFYMYVGAEADRLSVQSVEKQEQVSTIYIVDSSTGKVLDIKSPSVNS